MLLISAIAIINSGQSLLPISHSISSLAPKKGLAWQAQKRINAKPTLKDLFKDLDLWQISSPRGYSGDWRAGAFSGSCIKWITSGLEDSDFEPFPGLMRTGRLNIFVSGKPSTTRLAQTVEIVPWSITLYGARAGWTEAVLQANVMGQDSILLVTELSKLGKLQMLSYSQEGFVLKKFKLTSGRRTLYVLYRKDYGSAGEQEAFFFSGSKDRLDFKFPGY